MEIKEARELYKEQNGRYPSSKMLLENIMKKLDELTPREVEWVNKEELMADKEKAINNMVTIDNLNNPTIRTEAPKWVVKMTSRIYNIKKRNWTL